MKAEDRPTLVIDDEFKIEIDALQWIVCQRHITLKGNNIGEEYWTHEGFCRDLPDSLKKILLIKSEVQQDITKVSTYLDWYASIMHSMLDRVSRQEKVLRKAIEVNKVVVNTHAYN